MTSFTTSTRSRAPRTKTQGERCRDQRERRVGRSRGCAWLSPSWCGLVRSDLDRLSLIPAEVLANAGDTGPAGDKPGQRRVVRTRRITVDHGLAVGNLQQPGVVDLAPRCVPDEEAAESKLGRHIAVPSTPDPRRSRHGKRSKTGEPVSIAPCPSRRGHPTDRDDGVTCDGTQPRGHDRQHTPEPSSRLRDARVGCGAQGPRESSRHGDRTTGAPTPRAAGHRRDRPLRASRQTTRRRPTAWCGRWPPSYPRSWERRTRGRERTGRAQPPVQFGRG